MNRAERKRLEKQQKKEQEVINKTDSKQENAFMRNAKWMANLTDWQNECIKKTVGAAVTFAKTEAKIDAELDTLAILDKILTGTLLEKTDMSWKESFEFNKLLIKYYQEYRFIEAKIGREQRIIMLNELEKEIKIFVEGLIAEGKGKGVIVKAIRSNFPSPEITTPEAHNVYKRVFEEYKEYLIEKEPVIIKSMVEQLENNLMQAEIIENCKIKYPRIAKKELQGIYVLAKDEYNKPKYEDYSEVEGKAGIKKRMAEKEAEEFKANLNEEKVKEIGKAMVKAAKVATETIKPLGEAIKVTEEAKIPGLKVVNEVVKVVSRELEGEFGKYVASGDGVKRDDMTFADLQEVEKYKQEQLSKFELEIAELKAVFSFIE